MNAVLKSCGHFGAMVMVTFVSGCTIVPYGTPLTTSVTAPRMTAAPVPTLKVVFECGACRIRPGVSALISEAYAAAALKAGANVESNIEAVITITEYSERSDAARTLAGFLAGKDEIRGIVRYQAKTVAVADYYRNSWLGIEDLAENIGEMAFDVVK